MPNYKKMYLTLVNEVSNTIDSLTAALQEAEELYANEGGAEIQVMGRREDNKKTGTD